MRRNAHGIPITYVPARNTIFLCLRCLAMLLAKRIFLGVNALDYPASDCRPEFIGAFRRWQTSPRKQVEGRQHLRSTRRSSDDKARSSHGMEFGVDYDSPAVATSDLPGRPAANAILFAAPEGLPRNGIEDRCEEQLLASSF